MRKSPIFTILIIFYSAFLLIFPYFETFERFHPKFGNLNILIHILVFFSLIFFALYHKLKERALNSKEIVFIAIYSAFTAISRIPFIAIPSVQPCSFLIFSAGIVFGPIIGFMIGLNTALLSNFIAGQGPWTLYQIIAWGFIGMVGGMLSKSQNQLIENFDQRIVIQKSWFKKLKFFLFRVGISSLIFLLGLVYGLIMNIWSWLILEPPLTLEKFLIVYIASFPYDILHGISNIVFFWLFGSQTLHILTRYKDRLFSTIVHQEIESDLIINSKLNYKEQELN